MKLKSPASGKRQGLLSNSLGSKQDNSKIPDKPKPINREKTLEAIAIKWSAMGLYQSPARAMIALLKGEL